MRCGGEEGGEGGEVRIGKERRERWGEERKTEKQCMVLASSSEWSVGCMSSRSEQLCNDWLALLQADVASTQNHYQQLLLPVYQKNC